jgi:hypothetical protein
VGAESTPAEEPDEPISVVPFPVLDQAALQGTPGKIVNEVAPYTEAHPAAILAQLLARFGAEVGPGPHVLIGNREHPARINTMIVGRTSDGAKGTSHEVVVALFAAASPQQPGFLGLVRDPMRVLSGLSSGEGLIELVRDPNGDDPGAKNFDEGVYDKRLLIVEQEFSGVLAVAERQGSILARVLREAWDGDVLRTLSRHSPLQASGAHVVVVGHVTPGEFRIKLKEAQIVGGTVNRFIPIASRRTQFLADGGNIPEDLCAEFSQYLAVVQPWGKRLMSRSPDAEKLWSKSYPDLRRSRPDGHVAQMLARAAPQVMRIALAYSLVNTHAAIEYEDLKAALALWQYAEDTASWMFGEVVEHGDLDGLIGFITEGGAAGRTRSEINTKHYRGNKPATEITVALGQLMRDGRIRQETIKQSNGRGRPVTRYHT